ncbi:hypothetical protein MTR67_001828 [Solanum verrucosum]|uniref:Uncharacterized protein n=1 Tax=Solanum verrucosum TaxID=315347 RepID=A0AAF0PNV8_SOLVR|nr:hypothetical protein MTR67_001828 [Solanum verrucosum]
MVLDTLFTQEPLRCVVTYGKSIGGMLTSVNPVLHVSLLMKCIGDPTSVVPLESVGVKDSLSYKESPVEILNRQEGLIEAEDIFDDLDNSKKKRR